MPPGQLSGLLPCLSREKRPPPVSTSVKAFRHFIVGSFTLASPDHPCRNLVPAFLQRSPQPLLTAAACSGLRPAPDCRPRGAHPHLLHSTTSPYPGDVFVTHGACGPRRLRGHRRSAPQPQSRRSARRRRRRVGGLDPNQNVGHRGVKPVNGDHLAREVEIAAYPPVLNKSAAGLHRG